MDVADQNALATLLYLAKRSRDAVDTSELRFVVCNETHALVGYRQAALWLNESVGNLSGITSIEANAPYVLWLDRLMKHLVKASAVHAIKTQASDFPPELGREWADWLPHHALWIPFKDTNGSVGGLFVAREEAFTDAEVALLADWLEIWSQAWRYKQSAQGVRRWFRISNSNSQPFWRKVKVATLTLLVLGMFIPIPLRVLAPAELVPVHPAVIRAPLDGVVDRVLVLPNQKVERNQPLFVFDRAGIQNKLQVAQRAIATLQAEYKQRAQQSLLDPASKAALVPLQGQIAEKSTEINYLRHLNERGMAISPRDGVALLDDPNEWVGRPVVTGEKIMMVADPTQVEIEAWLTPSDVIDFPENAQVRLFLNTDPLEPVYAKLRYVSYEAVERPDQSYAYRVRATIKTNSSKARLGHKGMVRIEGPPVKLGYWIIRRPLAALRSWLGI